MQKKINLSSIVNKKLKLRFEDILYADLHQPLDGNLAEILDNKLWTPLSFKIGRRFRDGTVDQWDRDLGNKYEKVL